MERVFFRITYCILGCLLGVLLIEAAQLKVERDHYAAIALRSIGVLDQTTSTSSKCLEKLVALRAELSSVQDDLENAKLRTTPQPTRVSSAHSVAMGGKP